eukprot:TRINITY_DN6363_c0_g1_i1.p1 TRINITY_DN6363_c0_g1~~TRINITY_DN6363_c0_g1_i1.p1  ORF type:complete len:601 (+),score=103.52 TRINITY_DN6363_c0_g1_i1:73-1875(+)
MPIGTMRAVAAACGAPLAAGVVALPFVLAQGAIGGLLVTLAVLAATTYSALALRAMMLWVEDEHASHGSGLLCSQASSDGPLVVVAERVLRCWGRRWALAAEALTSWGLTVALFILVRDSLPQALAQLAVLHAPVTPVAEACIVAGVAACTVLPVCAWHGFRHRPPGVYSAAAACAALMVLVLCTFVLAARGDVVCTRQEEAAVSVRGYGAKEVHAVSALRGGWDDSARVGVAPLPPGSPAPHEVVDKLGTRCLAADWATLASPGTLHAYGIILSVMWGSHGGAPVGSAAWWCGRGLHTGAAVVFATVGYAIFGGAVAGDAVRSLPLWRTGRDAGALLLLSLLMRAATAGAAALALPGYVTATCHAVGPLARDAVDWVVALRGRSATHTPRCPAATPGPAANLPVTDALPVRTGDASFVSSHDRTVALSSSCIPVASSIRSKSPALQIWFFEDYSPAASSSPAASPTVPPSATPTSPHSPDPSTAGTPPPLLAPTPPPADSSFPTASLAARAVRPAATALVAATALLTALAAPDLPTVLSLTGGIAGGTTACVLPATLALAAPPLCRQRLPGGTPPAVITLAIGTAGIIITCVSLAFPVH